MDELSYIKSPYGKSIARISENDDQWITVETPQGDYRYFHSTNWTYFEKDMATEITETDFKEMTVKIKTRIANELLRREMLKKQS